MGLYCKTYKRVTAMKGVSATYLVMVAKWQSKADIKICTNKKKKFFFTFTHSYNHALLSEDFKWLNLNKIH